MNKGKKYITPLTINIPAEVVDFLKACEDNELDVYNIIDAIRDEETTVDTNEVKAVIIYEN